MEKSIETREVLDMARRLMDTNAYKDADLTECVIAVKDALAEAERPGTPEEKEPV